MFSITSKYRDTEYSSSYLDDGTVSVNGAVAAEMDRQGWSIDDLWNKPTQTGPARVYEPQGERDVRALFASLLELAPGEKTVVGDYPDLSEWMAGDVVMAGKEQPVESEASEGTKTLPVNVTPETDDPHSGAMIALMPTQDTARNLYVEGGLPESELHLTLLYLGDGADYRESQRDIIRAIVGDVIQGHRVVTASVAGAGTLGPDATVYLIGDSPALTDAYRDVRWAMMQAPIMASSADIRDPWIAHVTGGEHIDPKRLSYRGPVEFDRVRVAFEGTYTDFSFDRWEVIETSEAESFGVDLKKVLPIAEDDEPDADSDELSELGLKMMFMGLTDRDLGADMAGEFYNKDYGSRDPRAARLRRYWTRGSGAAKIRWGVPGDFKRAVKQLRKYVGARAEGLAAIYHRAALGVWPGRERGHKSLEGKSYWLDPGPHQYVKVIVLGDTITNITSQHETIEGVQ